MKYIASLEEMLSYIVEKKVSTICTLITHSFRYTGSVRDMGENILGEKGVFFDISEDSSTLCISLKDIVGIEFSESREEILSLGTSLEKIQYTLSGKLEVQRGIKKIEDILAVHVSCFGLPEDGYILNRIYRTFETLGVIFGEILQQSDAQSAWKEKIHSVDFLDTENTSIEIYNTQLIVSFPFTKLDAKPLDKEAVQQGILEQL